MKLRDRFRAAFGIVMKGSLFPFNKFLDLGSLIGGPKLDRPYEHSPWVMRAIKKISGPIAAVSLQFSLDKRGSEQLLRDPEMAEFWQSPALTATGPMTLHDFIEANVGWLKLAGEAFWILDDSYLAPFPDVGNRAPIIMARPDRMRHVIKGGKLIGWEFTDADSSKHLLLPEQVIQPKFWNPYDDFRGMPEYEAAKVAAEADYLSGRFNLNLARNNGDQGVYIVAKGGIPDDGQRKQIVTQLREKRELSQRGIFKPIFLGGDISIEDPKIRTPDAAFIAQRQENKKEVFIALGVPPSMAEPQASYSIGAASDRYILIEETCMPLGEKLCNHIEQAERKRRGKTVHCWFDWSEHSVMQQVRQEELKSVDVLWSKGMPLSEINDYLRLRMKPFAGWDVGYLPFNVAPVSEVESGTADPTQDPTYSETASAGDRGKAALRQIREAIEQRAKQGDHFQRGRSEKEKAIWRTHMAARRAVVKAFESKFRAELFKARIEMMGKIEASELQRGVHPHPGPLPQEGGIRTAAADFMFDLEKFRAGVLGSMRKVSAVALQSAGSELFKEVSRDDAFAMPPGKALEFLKDRENKLSGVADEVFDRIKGAVQDGLTAGDSIKDLSARVRGEFNDLGRGRATVIAMTETAAAYGVARDEAMQQAGVQYKQWLTSGNDNVRPAHAAANGQVVKVEDAFEVDGEALDHPADPAGAPENVINCHCVAIAVEKPNDES